MKREDFISRGWRIIDPNNADSSGIMLRPRNWSLPEGYNVPNVIELSDIDLLSSSFCKECLEFTSFIPKGIKTSQIIADIIDGKPALVVLHKHKGLCKNCGKSQVMESLYGRKQTSSDEFDKYIIKTILTDNGHDKKYTSFEVYGVSKSYSEKLVKCYLDKMRSSIKSVYPCDQLILYPFEYEGKQRCCLCGLREGTNDTVLLSILPDYDVSTITQFLSDKASYFSSVDDLFCDLNPSVYGALCSLANEAYTAIITQRITEEAQKLLDTEKQRRVTEFTNALGAFIDIIRKQKKHNYSIPQKLIDWWNNLSYELQLRIQPLWSKVEPCLGGCYSPYKYDYTAVNEVLSLIEGFRTRGTSYKSMVDRMLFTIPAVRSKFFPDEAMHMAYVNNPLFELHDFYVDIPTLEHYLGNNCGTENAYEIISSSEALRMLTQVFSRYRIRKAILFKSYTRNLQNTDTDIYILVDGDLNGSSLISLGDDIWQTLGIYVRLFDTSHIEPSLPIIEQEQNTGIVIYSLPNTDR